MIAAQRQISIGGLETEAEERAEIEAGYMWREALYGALRSFAATYSAEGLKGYDACAAALDKRWGERGRPVSASVLRAALHDVERNNFRAEWLDWFACRSADVADLLARRVKPEKTDRQLYEDLVAELRENEMSHKRVEQVVRKARTR